MQYSHFWAVVRDFQTLIGVSVSFIAVLSGVLGIVLKARLDNNLAQKKLRDGRRETALSLYSMIRMERNFPEISLFRIPSDNDVFEMLSNVGNAAMGINSYIAYLMKFVSTLSGFPRPAADRAHFISWISARTALAMAAVHNAEQTAREAMARRYAPEVRKLLIAGIVVLDELADELACYECAPEEYEEQWRNPEILGTSIHGNRSRRFDRREIKTRVWEICLKPSAGLGNSNDGTNRRFWLEALLKNIDSRVAEDRKEVWHPLEDIYERCEQLPETSVERQTLERLVVAIWKGGEEKINEEDVRKLDADTLGIVRDLGRQAGRSWRL